MTDEQQEELASLYALDLLEGEEKTRFETALAREPALQKMVQELRDSSASLAHLPAAVPPPELKDRVLGSIAAESAPRPAPNAKLAVFRTLAPWAMAAGFALVGLWLAQRLATMRGELALARTEAEIADVGLRSARNLREAEQIVTQKQILDLSTRITDGLQKLADATRLTAEASQKLAEAGEAGRRKDAEVTTLTQRLADAGTELAALTQRLQVEGDLANLKIATLASMLNNTPQALAVAVWNPQKQEGIFTIEKMPLPAADQNYELWVIEAKPDAKPVSAGVFVMDADGTRRVRFKPTATVGALAKFAVSRERKDGATSHAQPSEVVMISP